jgi:signal transduction histidine kinase
MIFQSNDFEIKLKNKQIELFVYRIIQEFFNNSCKHANASMLILHILKETENKQFHFSLRDNGIGFDFNEKQNAYNGNGIANIDYRLKIIKAKYNFGSAPNKGTFLNFSVSY